MRNIFYKTKYFFGTIYRGLIGRYHNAFDKEPTIIDSIPWFSIGMTLEGYHIKCYKISKQEYTINSNKILIIGGIHGNEVGTVKLAKHMVNYFWQLKEKINLEIFLIPCLNMDGYMAGLKNPDYAHRGRVGRNNARGVDLNRNFPTKNFQKNSEWGFGRNYEDEKIDVYCGEFGASEPEIQALINFIKQENIINLFVLHNAGKDLVYNEADEVAKSWSEIYHQFTKFKIRTDLNYSGSAAEWAKENDIHYLTVEGSSRWGSDWPKQKKAIEKIIDEISNM